MNSTQTMSPIALLIERLRNLHKNAVFRRSVLLAFLLYLSPVMGMILELALIRVFSAGAVLDSFRALMTFMLMGQGVITAQLLKYAVIPRLAEFRAQNKDREGLIFTLYFTGIVLFILSPVFWLGMFWPEVLLIKLAPGFSDELVHQSAGLVRVTTIGFMLTTVLGSMTAVLNFYGNFWGQPLSQLILNVTLLVAVLVFGNHLSQPEQLSLLEISVGIGLVMMFALMASQCIKVWISTAQNTVKLDLMQALALSFVTLIPQLFIITSEIIKPLSVNRALSEVGVGSIVLYLFAFKLLMIGNLPIKAIVTVLFPDYSRMNGNVESALLQKKLVNGTLKIFALMSVASFVLWFIAPYIVSMLSLFANMTNEAVSKVTGVYRILLFFAPFASLGLFYVELAFAFNEKPLMIIYSITNTALIVILLPWFIHWDIEGVAMVYSMVQGSCMLALGAALYLQIQKRSKISSPDI